MISDASSVDLLPSLRLNCDHSELLLFHTNFQRNFIVRKVFRNYLSDTISLFGGFVNLNNGPTLSITAGLWVRIQYIQRKILLALDTDTAQCAHTFY